MYSNSSEWNEERRGEERREEELVESINCPIKYNKSERKL